MQNENEKRSTPRVMFEKANWRLSLLIKQESLDDKYPKSIKPWDFSVNGVSFVCDVPFVLDTCVELMLYSPIVSKVMLLSGQVIRVDQVRKIEDPVISYKVAVKFNDIDLEYYQYIRGVTE